MGDGGAVARFGKLGFESPIWEILRIQGMAFGWIMVDQWDLGMGNSPTWILGGG